MMFINLPRPNRALRKPREIGFLHTLCIAAGAGADRTATEGTNRGAKAAGDALGIRRSGWATGRVAVEYSGKGIVLMRTLFSAFGQKRSPRVPCGSSYGECIPSVPLVDTRASTVYRLRFWCRFSCLMCPRNRANVHMTELPIMPNIRGNNE